MCSSDLVTGPPPPALLPPVPAVVVPPPVPELVVVVEPWLPANPTKADSANLEAALSLAATADHDHDGYSNAIESLAGTNPLDPASYPSLDVASGPPGQLQLSWSGEFGKKYSLFRSLDLSGGNGSVLDTFTGDGTTMMEVVDTSGPRGFFTLLISDLDSDLDGLTDWEEAAMGFDPTLSHTDRNDTADLTRVQTTLQAASTVTVARRVSWSTRGSRTRTRPRRSRRATTRRSCCSRRPST